MKHVLNTDEGKTVVLDPDSDDRIYKAPRNPPNTGIKFTRGVDIYVHISRKGRRFFYTYSWSMWQAETDDICLITEQAAKKKYQEKLGSADYWVHPDESYTNDALKIWPNLLEETA